MKYIITLLVITQTWITEPCNYSFFGGMNVRCGVIHQKILVSDTSVILLLKANTTDIPKDTIHQSGQSFRYKILKIDTLKNPVNL